MSICPPPAQLKNKDITPGLGDITPPSPTLASAKGTWEPRSAPCLQHHTAPQVMGHQQAPSFWIWEEGKKDTGTSRAQGQGAACC